MTQAHWSKKIFYITIGAPGREKRLYHSREITRIACNNTRRTGITSRGLTSTTDPVNMIWKLINLQNGTELTMTRQHSDNPEQHAHYQGCKAFSPRCFHYERRNFHNLGWNSRAKNNFSWWDKFLLRGILNSHYYLAYMSAALLMDKIDTNWDKISIIRDGISNVYVSKHIKQGKLITVTFQAAFI